MSGDSTNHTPILWQAMSAAWIRILLLFPSLLVSGVVVAAALQHIVFLDTLHALLPGLIATALLSGVLVFILPRLAQELQVCDPSLRHIIIGLIAGGMVVVFFSTPAPAPHTLTWHWDAGQQAGAPAPVFSGASWDGVNRSVIELHATDDSNATLYGVWRAEAALDEIAGMRPARVELWLTQPSWAVIDPATGNPGPNVDGVDVTISVQREQETLLERHIALDPPAIPEQRAWHNVVLNLPPDSERLVVDVQMRKTSDSARVWVTEAVVRPAWNSMLDRVALALIVVFAVSTLAFARRLPQIVSASRRVSVFFSNYGYLLVGVACLWLGYLLVWQRGFYLDDWGMGLRARDQQTLEWLPIEVTPEAIPTFPARILTFIMLPRLIAFMWTDEFLVRLLIACCVGLNAFLLGWLVYRILRSRMPAIVAGWLFLMPIYTDVTLWAGAAAYVFIAGLTLLMLHATWSALVIDGPPYIWLLVGSLALLTSLVWAEATMGIVSMIPLMGVLCRVQRPDINWRTIGYRTLLSTIALTMIVLLYSLLLLSASRLVPERGGFTTDSVLILQRAGLWLKALFWYTLDPSWGHRFTVASYIVGSNHILISPTGRILLSGISIILALTVVSWKSDRIQFSNITPVLLMLVFGIGWFLTTLYVPYLFVAQQIFERRFLYFPLAGLSIAVGALIALTKSIIRCRGLQQALLAASGVLLVILSLCMVGHARLYAARYETDVKAFTSLGQLVPAWAIPERAQFIPVNLDYSLSGQENLLTGLIISAFEAPWSAYAGLDPLYPGKNIEYITSSRWVPATFSEHPPATAPGFCNRHAQTPQITALESPTLFVQGCPVDPARAIVFTSRSGELTLVRTLTLQRSDGTTRVIELPIASMLATHGSAAIETLVIPVSN